MQRGRARDGVNFELRLLLKQQLDGAGAAVGVLRLPAAPAALHLRGAMPAEALWRECADVLAESRHGATARSVCGGEPQRGAAPSYWRHRGEWAPEFTCCDPCPQEADRTCHD